MFSIVTMISCILIQSSSSSSRHHAFASARGKNLGLTPPPRTPTIREYLHDWILLLKSTSIPYNISLVRLDVMLTRKFYFLRGYARANKLLRFAWYYSSQFKNLVDIWIALAPKHDVTDIHHRYSDSYCNS